MRAALVLTLAVFLGLTSRAGADAIGGCPEGQHFRSNPTQPGAMHHSGGECVGDPSPWHCAAMPGARGASLAALVGLASLAVGVRRRDKVRAR